LLLSWHRATFLIISLAAVVVLSVAAIYAGPLSSGALFLLIPPRATAFDHRVPSTYEPLHKAESMRASVYTHAKMRI